MNNFIYSSTILENFYFSIEVQIIFLKNIISYWKWTKNFPTQFLHYMSATSLVKALTQIFISSSLSNTIFNLVFYRIIIALSSPYYNLNFGKVVVKKLVRIQDSTVWYDTCFHGLRESQFEVQHSYFFSFKNNTKTKKHSF